MRRLLEPLAAVLMLAALAACSTLTVEKPEGFAELESGKRYRAVSPEGLLYEVRTVKNYPEQDLEFWGRALKSHLVREGYRFTGREERFQAGQQQGILYEWGVPYGSEDYIYLTALIVFNNSIAVAEAAGPHSIYRQYREGLLQSLRSISYR